MRTHATLTHRILAIMLKKCQWL